MDRSGRITKLYYCDSRDQKINEWFFNVFTVLVPGPVFPFLLFLLFIWVTLFMVVLFCIDDWSMRVIIYSLGAKEKKQNKKTNKLTGGSKSRSVHEHVF